MAINNSPLFVGTANIAQARFTTGFGTADLSTNTTVGNTFKKIFQADTTYGSYVQKSRIKVLGNTSFNTTSSAFVLKIMLCTSATATTTNLKLYDEVAIPSLTITPTGITPNFEIIYDLALAPGMSMWAGWTAVGSNAFDITTIGGDY